MCVAFECTTIFDAIFSNFSEGGKINPTIVLSSSDVEPDNTSRRKKRKSAEPKRKFASSQDKGKIIDVKKPQRVKVKSEEPVKKCTTRNSSKIIKKRRV